MMRKRRLLLAAGGPPRSDGGMERAMRIGERQHLGNPLLLLRALEHVEGRQWYATVLNSRTI